MFSRIKALLFENRGTKQTIVKNFFWLTSAQIASRFIRAAIIIYAARTLGAAGYGVFSYALGLAGFFSIFADIGIGSILTREAAQKPEHRTHYLVTSLWIKLFLLLGTVLAIIFIAPHFSKIEAAKALIPIVAFLIVFDGIRDLSIAFVRALEKMEIEAFITIFMNVAITVTGFLVLSYVATAKAFTFAYVGSAGAGMLAAIIILRKEFSKIFSHFRKKLVRQIMNAAMPIAFISLVGAFMFNTDLVMLGWWRTSTEIGFYSAAQKIIQVLYTLPGILASVFFPTISRLVGQKKDAEIKSLTERGITSLLLIAIPLTVGGIILAKPIINLLYGQEYAPATGVFQILIFTTLLFPSALIANLVLSYNKQRDAVKFVALASFGNIFLNILLIPRFGIVGAAIATSLAQLTVSGCTWLMMKRVNNFYTLRHLKKISLAVLIMGTASFFLNKFGLHVLPSIIISGLIYFFALLVLKERVVKEIIVMAKQAIKR